MTTVNTAMRAAAEAAVLAEVLVEELRLAGVKNIGEQEPGDAQQPQARAVAGEAGVGVRRTEATALGQVPGHVA